MSDSPLCTIYVDGKQLLGPTDVPLLEFLAANDIELPHICYHPQLGAPQTCDTCWLEVNGELQRGCSIKAREGLNVRVENRTSQAARREGIDRIAARHELYCSVCENNNGNCGVKTAVKQIGVPYQKYPFQKTPYEKDESHPFYVYDPDQCILCGRCVEACQNVQVTETLSIDWEREHPRVLWDGGEVANESSCVSCGHCVTVCPCNALMEKAMLGEAGPLTAWPDKVKRPAIDLIKTVEESTGFGWIMGLSEMDAAWRAPDVKRTKTVCTYCGVGCSFEVWTKDRKVLRIQPQEDGPANGISTCVKGKFGWGFVDSEARLTTPLIREGDHFREASWDEAYALIARRFTEIRDAHGPDALMFVASSKYSNEEAYLMQKLARAVIGTNNIDNCSRYCQSPATQGLWRTVGYGGDEGTIEDLQMADLVLIVGSNTAENHPVIATRLKRAQKLHGQKHIVADLRRHEMAERADVFIRPNPGSDIVWLSALSRYILDQGLEAREFLAERVNHLDEYRKSLEPFTLEFAEQVSGIPVQQLKDIAHMIVAAERVCGVWAMGVTQRSNGSDTSTAIANLLLVTGNSGRPGTGPYPMRGHNNVQGASDFGAMSDRLPGYDKVSDDEARARFEKGWGAKLPAEKGYNNHTVVEAIHEGKVKSVYIAGEEMAVTDANKNYVTAGFDKLDFMVVQDIFFTRTCEHADVVLPAAPSLEKEGTFVNTERRIQRFYQALEPLGDSRPDWRIHMEVAQAMGADWHYDGPADIMREIAELTPLFAGVSYERLEGFKSLCWPVAADGTDTPHLYLDAFHFPDGKARLHPLEYSQPVVKPDAEYDLHMNNGRLLETFHEGNMTNRTEGLVEQIPHKFIEVSPELARERGLQSGSLVRLSSPEGDVEVQVLVSERVQGRQLFMTETAQTVHHATNSLTSNVADKDSDTPAYKEVAVKMEVLQREGETPLPLNNFRHYHATPRSGVETERKWQRVDYVEPPRVDPTPEKF
jgi:formate dehydrogenase major subunit